MFAKLVPVLALAAAGCGGIKIPGVRSGGRPSAPAPAGTRPAGDAPAAAAAPGAAQAAGPQVTPKLVRLQPGFVNPTQIRGLRARTPMRSNDLGLGCDARYAEQPVAIVELSRATSKLQISAPGAGAVAVVFDGKGACGEAQYANQAPVLVLDEWPAGKAAIYVGDSRQDVQLDVALHFEELGRAVDLGWDQDEKIERIKLDAPPAKPIVVHVVGGAPRKYASLGSGCSSTSFRAQPDFVIEASAVLPGLSLGVRSQEHSILVTGPLTPDRRNSKQRCLTQSDHYSLGRLEPGIYGVSLGGDEGPGPAFSNLVLAGPDTPADPTALAPIVPAKLELGERNVMVHFPQLGEELYRSDDLRFGILGKAPRRLFVYVGRDLDARSADLIGVGDVDANRPGQTWPEGDAPARALPHKDEPVLLIGGSHILTLDGNLFAIDARDLAAAPGGAVKLPDAPRVPEAALSFSLEVSDAAGAKLVKDYRASKEAYTACNTMIWDRASRDIEAIRTGPYRRDADEVIAALQDKTRRKVIAQCKLDALEKKERQTWAKLIELRTARRARDLATVRDHFSAQAP